MFWGNNGDAPRCRGLHPNLDLALTHITPEFLAALGPDRVELKGQEVYCGKFTYDTVPEEQSFFEAHQRYLDIHIMLEGTERVDIASPAVLQLTEARPQEDFWAYQGTAQQSLLLSPGQFLVVFPEDAHRLKIQVGAPATVTKAVFKVKIL